MPRLVDLSQEIYQGMGVYPGHLKTVVWDHATHAETIRLFEGGFSFHSQGLMMCDHGPTHVDAISHLDPADGAPSIDEMPLDTFYGPALCIDVSHVEPPEYITVDDLVQALDAGDTAEYRRVLSPTEALSRQVFAAPTQYYKTGVAFLSWLNGHQPAFSMVGGLHSARLLLASVDFAEVEQLQVAGQWDRAGELLAAEATRLELAGADLLVLCTNTMHKVAPAIERAVSVPLLHLGDATAAAVSAAGCRTAGLLGTAFTMSPTVQRGGLATIFSLPSARQQPRHGQNRG